LPAEGGVPRSAYRHLPPELPGIDRPETGPVLRLGEVDLLDGTPVLDIKPYIPYPNALPRARPRFAAEPSATAWAVDCTTEAWDRKLLHRIAQVDAGRATLLDRERNSGAIGIAVAHHSRTPGYWRERIRT
jgi:hypothetical protein